MSEPHGTPEAHDERDHVPDAHGSSHAVEGVHGSTADHGDEHGHDDHAHAGMALGPIDWRMWLVGVVGVGVAIVVTAGFVVATSFQFNA
jgi:ABC-type Zn2+ transport system substrate-binding protein/surface adhesin